MTSEEIFVKAIAAGMVFDIDGHLDCSELPCKDCVFVCFEGCSYSKHSSDLRKQGIYIQVECAKLLPLYREQHPELFI